MSTQKFYVILTQVATDCKLKPSEGSLGDGSLDLRKHCPSKRDGFILSNLPKALFRKGGNLGYFSISACKRQAKFTMFRVTTFKVKATHTVDSLPPDNTEPVGG